MVTLVPPGGTISSGDPDRRLDRRGPVDGQVFLVVVGRQKHNRVGGQVGVVETRVLLFAVFVTVQPSLLCYERED